MKKAFLLATAALLAAGLLCGQSVTVTAPNGGERWSLGEMQNITWTHSGTSGNVRINLLNSGGGVVGTIATVPVGDGSYPWTVGDWSAGTAAAGEYLIGLYVRNDDVDDRSDRSFSLVDPASPPDPGDPEPTGAISNVRLSGASPHRIGADCTVSWSAAGVSQTLKLQLIRSDGTLVGPIINSLAAGTTSYVWPAGQYIGGSAEPGENYRIRVATTDNALTADSPTFALTNFELLIPGVAYLARNLELVSVRHVLSRGGWIVARVKNYLNPIDMDVSFRLTFPEGGGPGAQTVVRRLTLAVGAEGDVYLHPLAPDGVPPAGLLARVMVDGPTSQIDETNERDNTGEARFTILDVRVSAPRNDLELSRLYMQGGWDYRLKFKIRVTHNQSNPVGNIRVKWEMFDSGGLMRFAGGSWTIESLAGGEEWVKTAEQKFGQDGRRNAHHPKLKKGATYRVVASITSPDDFSRNNTGGFSFTVPD